MNSKKEGLFRKASRLEKKVHFPWNSSGWNNLLLFIIIFSRLDYFDLWKTSKLIEYRTFVFFVFFSPMILFFQPSDRGKWYRFGSKLPTYRLGKMDQLWTNLYCTGLCSRYGTIEDNTSKWIHTTTKRVLWFGARKKRRLQSNHQWEALWVCCWNSPCFETLQNFPKIFNSFCCMHFYCCVVCLLFFKCSVAFSVDYPVWLHVAVDRFCTKAASLIVVTYLFLQS